MKYPDLNAYMKRRYLLVRARLCRTQAIGAVYMAEKAGEINSIGIRTAPFWRESAPRWFAEGNLRLAEAIAFRHSIQNEVPA